MLHTKYSPSSAHRWLNCAASLQPSDEERVSNIHAEQGTAAHALLEMSLRIGREPAKFLGSKRMHKKHPVDEEMASAVSHAYDWIHAYLALNKNAEFYIEHQVLLNNVLEVEQHEQGTADVIIDNYPEELVIMDYKHGAGIRVDVEQNPQLMLYAAGYSFKKKYKRYRHVVVQPRARHKDGPVREWVCTHKELAGFVRYVVKRVAFNEENPDHAEAGDWCKWCAHASRCKALTAYALKTAQMEFNDDAEPPAPNTLSVEEVADALRKSFVIESWLKAIRGGALAAAMSGTKIPGFKLAQGRSIRYFADEDEDKIITILDEYGFEENEYAPRKLIGVPGVEKLFKSRKRGAKIPKKLAKMIRRSKPAIHLVPESDERDEYQRGSEFDSLD